jgi:phosphoglycerate dehydrogenase-like enzyme
MKSNFLIKNKKVCVTTVAFSKNEKLIDKLNLLPFKEVITNKLLKRFNQEELIDFLKDAEIAIIGLDQITPEVLKSLPKLELISKYGVGLDNIDFVACEINKVNVIYPKGVNKRSVSELVLGNVLSLSRNLYVSSNNLKKNIWEKQGGRELSAKTFGIIGLGNVGKDLVSLLQPFNCNILVNDLVYDDEFLSKYNLVKSTKEEIYSQSDIISLHVPSTNDTFEMISKKEIRTMKDGVILINSARGELLNYKDIYEGLCQETIGGLAIDVYDQEPPTIKEIISMENVINTPHIGGNSAEAVLAMGDAAINNIINFYGDNR